MFIPNYAGNKNKKSERHNLPSRCCMRGNVYPGGWLFYRSKSRIFFSNIVGWICVAASGLLCCTLVQCTYVVFLLEFSCSSSFSVSNRYIIWGGRPLCRILWTLYSDEVWAPKAVDPVVPNIFSRADHKLCKKSLRPTNS